MKLLTYLQKKHRVTRREFTQMLHAGAVSLNGKNVETFDTLTEEGDALRIDLGDGQLFEEVVKIAFHSQKLILFYKPKGCVVSKDDKHNKTIYDILPKSRKRDFRYIGRLDKESSGLLLLTNTPSLVDYYENPKHDIHKVYEVQIDKPFRTKDTRKAKKGCRVTQEGSEATNEEDGELLGCVSVRYYRDSKGKYRLVMTLNEGKKRHIRRLLKYLGYKVIALKRVKVGKWQLGDLKPGKRRMQKKVK